MTKYEWKITSLGKGSYGHIWIADDGQDELGSIYRIHLDPYDADGAFARMNALKRAGEKFINDGDYFNRAADTELSESWSSYGRILRYWKSLGSPVVEQNAPGYTAPWFPWGEAGFRLSETVDILSGNTNSAAWVGDGDEAEEKHERAALAVEEAE